jgi:hypothetical protein
LSGASRHRNALALVIFSATLTLGLLLVSTKAWADFPVPQSTPGLLSLWTNTYPVHYSGMAPGDEAYLRLDVELDDTDRGDLELDVRKGGALATVPDGLTMSVERCTAQWTNVPSGVTSGGTPFCSSGRVLLLEADPSADYSAVSPSWALGEIVHGTPVHLLVTLALPDSTPPQNVTGLSADFGIGLFASGDGGPGPVTPAVLASTGLDVFSLLLVAVGAMGVGIAVARSRAQKEKSEQ